VTAVVPESRPQEVLWLKSRLVTSIIAMSAIEAEPIALAIFVLTGFDFTES
jgi:hypothetical protein